MLGETLSECVLVLNVELYPFLLKGPGAFVEVLKELVVFFFFFRPMPQDDYMLVVKVDGVPIPTSGMCNGNPWNYWCIFYVSSMSYSLVFQFSCGLLWYFIPYRTHTGQHSGAIVSTVAS